MSLEGTRSFNDLRVGAQEIITDCLAAFDGCSQNDKHEVKVSDIAEAIARMYLDESPEIAAEMSRIKLELSSFVYNSDYISREQFGNVVSSFVTVGASERTEEEHFTHVPSENVPEYPVYTENNNVTPQQTPTSNDRYKKYLDSLERTLSSKTSQLEQSRKEVKRLRSEKENFLKKIASLEEDLLQNVKVTEDSKESLKRLEIARQSLEIKLKVSERKLKESSDREEKLETLVVELKTENSNFSTKITHLRELEKEVVILKNQLAMVTEEKNDAIQHSDSLQKAIELKVIEETKRSLYIEELKRKLGKMIRLQEENEATLGLDFLRVMYDCDQDEFPISPGQSSLMLEIAGAACSTPKKVTDRQAHVMDVSTTSENEVHSETAFVSVPKIVPKGEIREGSLDSRFSSRIVRPVKRVMRCFGSIAVSVLLLLLFFYVSREALIVSLYITGLCEFGRSPCWATLFGKKYFYYELTSPPPC